MSLYNIMQWLLRRRYDARTRNQTSPLLESQSSDEDWKVGATLSKALNTWAMLERQVEVHIWIALRKKAAVGACFTNEIQSIRTKLIIFESLLEHYQASKATLKGLKKFRNSIEGLTKQRNRLVHDPHMIKGSDLLLYRGARFLGDGELFSTDQLINFRIECLNKNDEFYKLAGSALTEIGFDPDVDTPVPSP